MSYTPTNWATGDTVTAEKLNKIEQGIQAVTPYSNPFQNGQIIRYLNGTGMTSGSINSIAEPFAYYFEIDVDEQLNFTTDITKQVLYYDKWMGGFSIFASIFGYFCPLYAAPFSNAFDGPAFQTNIIDLDPLGMTGYIGFLTLYPMSDDTGYTCVLYKWQVS